MGTVGDRVITKSTTYAEMPMRWPVGEVQGSKPPRLGLGQWLMLMTWIQESVMSRGFRGQM